jgi:hypothetical protein
MAKDEQVSGSQTETDEDLLDFDLDDLTSEDLDEGENDIIELVDLVEEGDESRRGEVDAAAESVEIDDLDVFGQEEKTEEPKPGAEVDLDVSDISLDADATKAEQIGADETPAAEVSTDDVLGDLAIEEPGEIETVSAEDPPEEKGSGTMEFVADSDLEKLFEEELRAEKPVEAESVDVEVAELKTTAEAVEGDEIVSEVDETPPDIRELPPDEPVKVEESFQEIVEEVEPAEQMEEISPEPSSELMEEPAPPEEPLVMEEPPPAVEEIAPEPSPAALSGLTEEKVEQILTRVVGEVVERVTRETVAEVAERVTRETVTTVAERVIGEAIEALKKSMER